MTNKLWISAIMMFTIFNTSSWPQEQAKLKKNTAAILDFISTAGITGQEAASLTSKFRTSLAKTQKYELLELEKMKDILKAQDFSMSDNCNSQECAVQVGQLLAMEKMVAGEIGKVGKTYTVNIRLIDITTGKVEKTENKDYIGEIDGLLKEFDVMAQKIAGTYIKKSNTKWWLLGGVAVAGGTTAFLILNKANKTPDPFGTPPNHP